MNESLEEKYRRLQSEIQRAILQNYPNPGRQGCPGNATVRNFATNPESIKAEDEDDVNGAWYHISHCSPCYASFLELRNAERADWVERKPVDSQGDSRGVPYRRGWRRWLDWLSPKRQTSHERMRP